MVVNPTVFEFNGVGLVLSDLSLASLTELDASLMWSGRGLTGHEQDQSALNDYEAKQNQLLAELKQSAVGQKKIADFGAEVRDVMRSILLGNYQWLNQYMGDRHFVILCGLHRSGGSYLLDELSTILNFPYQKYHCMHDDLPSFFPVVYWKWPHMYLQYIAEVAQFLVIVKRTVPWKIVVKKRAIWTLAIESLAHIFANRLTLYVHVRHPISWACGDTDLREGGKNKGITIPDSFRQYLDIYDTPLRGSESPCELMIRFWKYFHIESFRKGVPYHVLPFGDYGTHLDDLAAQTKPGYKPAPFNPTPRDYSQYAAHFEQAEAAMQDVQAHWAKYGVAFPKPRLV